MERFAHVRQALRLEPQLLEAVLECELAVDRPEVVRHGSDRAAVQVESALGIAARAQEQQRASRSAVCLGLVQVDVPAESAEAGHLIEVEIFGDSVTGQVAEEPLWDPAGERIRA